MKVFLTGASGFVGSHMLQRLLSDGHSVRVLVRQAPRLVPVPESANLEIAVGDVVTGEGLQAGMADCDAVIHLVGIILESGASTFDRVHRQGTKNVVQAAQQTRIKRFVHMSAIGASANGVSGYQTSKWAAEEEVRRSDIQHVILRPSIIFGPGDGFVSQMVDVMKSAPLMRPIVGSGKYPFRPIWIGNVVDCFLQALTSAKAIDRTIEIGGPGELTLKEMLRMIAKQIGVTKPAVSIPFPLMYAGARLLGTLLNKPPVTTDQLRMLRQGSTCDIRPMLETFDLTLVSFGEGLTRYLQTYSP